MLRKTMALFLAAVMAAGMLLTGCSKSDAQKIRVDSVAEITGTGYTGLNSRFSGMIVSGSTQKIDRDKDKKILELNVSVGDFVDSGDVLFSYDVEAVELALKRLELECEQLENSLVLIRDNIKIYQKKVDSSKGSQKLEYEVELQSCQIDEKEKTMELSSKEAELARTTEMLENAEVVSRVSGVIQSINDNAGETDENGELIPYITIIETGAYRVKCSVSELDVNSIREGGRVIIRSRVSEDIWTGAIEYIEWDNPEKTNNVMFGAEEGNSASRYPFYVCLDSTDGLLMGQHVYVEMDTGEAAGLMIPEYYICDAEGDAWLWAANRRDRIEKRPVELGEYNPELCCYEVLSGLTPEDYIAFPDETVEAGTPVIREGDMEAEGEEFSDDFVAEDGEFYDESVVFEDEGFIGEDVIVDEFYADGGEVVIVG